MQSFADRDAGGFIGSGHAGGLQLPSSGRLLFPMHGPCHMIYSDDFGSTFKKAPGSTSRGGECQAAILPAVAANAPFLMGSENETLIMTARNDKVGFTLLSYSRDQGMTWTEAAPNKDLPSPIDGVEASLVAHPNGKL